MHGPSCSEKDDGDAGLGLHFKLIQLSMQVGGVRDHESLYLCQDAHLFKVECHIKLVRIQPKGFPVAGVQHIIYLCI